MQLGTYKYEKKLVGKDIFLSFAHKVIKALEQESNLLGILSN